ncbi:MAG: fadB, partial [Bryobacterales bacterium]|nr:fadB [Bryobacterales bacterium]
MNQPVTLATRTLSTSDRVAVITIDNPPVNALSPGVPEGILTALDTAERDASVRAIVVIGGGRTFIAGADIKELEEAARNPAGGGPDLHPLLTR